MDKKEFILNNISMIDILNKCGIRTKRSMFSCPFHGADKTPSAKAYKNSYYCFACGHTGDLIQFVQDYFNLTFLEAIEKINFDFNLNLSENKKIDKNKLNQIKKQKELKEQREKYINTQMVKACNIYIIYNKLLKNFKKNINIDNWEDNTLAILYLRDKLNKLDLYMENLQNKRLGT